MDLFLRRFRFALRLGCPLSAGNSTLSPRKVFLSTYTPRTKTYFIFFAACGRRNSVRPY